MMDLQHHFSHAALWFHYRKLGEEPAHTLLNTATLRSNSRITCKTQHATHSQETLYFTQERDTSQANNFEVYLVPCEK